MKNDDGGMGVTSIIMPKSELDSINAKRRGYGLTWAYLVRRGMSSHEEEIKQKMKK